MDNFNQTHGAVVLSVELKDKTVIGKTVVKNTAKKLKL